MRCQEKVKLKFLRKQMLVLVGIKLHGSYFDQGKLTLYRDIFITVCKIRKVKLRNTREINLLTDKYNESIL
jgi:hypothetical protein